MRLKIIAAPAVAALAALVAVFALAYWMRPGPGPGPSRRRAQMAGMKPMKPTPTPKDPKAACSLPIVPGVCDASFRKFAYDTAKKQCRQFVYGGCGGNANNFNTLGECQTTCESEDPKAFCTGKKGKENPCLHIPKPPKTLSAWRYDPAAKKCTKMTFSGCGLRSDQFGTQAECDAAVAKYCNPGAGPRSLDPAAFCAGDPGKPMTRIACTGNWAFAWSFQPKTGACEQFRYSPCEVYPNVYRDQAECDAAAKKFCIAEPVA